MCGTAYTPVKHGFSSGSLRALCSLEPALKWPMEKWSQIFLMQSLFKVVLSKKNLENPGSALIMILLGNEILPKTLCLPASKKHTANFTLSL